MITRVDRALIEALAGVHGGSDWRSVDALDFSGNMNPIGPPLGLREALAEAVEGRVAERFPANAAEEVLSEYEGVRAVAFNGATEAALAVMAWLRPRRVLLVWPAYADYLRLAELVGAEPLLADWLWEAVEAAGEGDLVVLVNPNNPLGYCVPRREVVDAAVELSKRGAWLLVDESFADFAGLETAAPEALVVKSYGKFLAAPGLRVGAVLGDVPRLLAHPWRLNSMADYALWRLGPEALRRHRDRTIAYVSEEAPRVVGELSRCVEVFDTCVHFFAYVGEVPARARVRDLSYIWPGLRRASIRSRWEDDVLIREICRANGAARQSQTRDPLQL